MRSAGRTCSPGADGLLALADPALSQHLLNVSKAQAEPEIKPDRMTDHFGWKAVTLERNSRHWGFVLPNAGYTRDQFAFA